MTGQLRYHLKSFKKQVNNCSEVVHLPSLRRIKIVYKPLDGDKIEALSHAVEAWKTTITASLEADNPLWLQRLQQVNDIINLAVVFHYSRRPFAPWQRKDDILDLLSLPTREEIAVRIEKKVLAFWLLPAILRRR